MRILGMKNGLSIGFSSKRPSSSTSPQVVKNLVADVSGTDWNLAVDVGGTVYNLVVKE